MTTHCGKFTRNESKKVIRARLPKITVKRFGGKIQEWQEFWDSFYSSVNQNDCLSDVDKFTYLKGLLTEPARSTIAGFSLTAANYKDALDLFKNRNGKKNIIQTAHIQELLKLKPVFSNRDTARLRKLYDACETNYRALKAQGVDAISHLHPPHSTIVVPAIMEKLHETLE